MNIMRVLLIVGLISCWHQTDFPAAQEFAKKAAALAEQMNPKKPAAPNVDNDLMEAAKHGNFAVVRQCLHFEPKANIQTPLASAAALGYPEVIDVLIGENQLTQDQLITALGIAAQYGRTDIVNQLVPKVRREAPGLFAKAKKLLQGGTPLVKPVTPLMYACKYQQSQVVDTLLNSQESTENFTINYYDSTGMTALIWACKTAYNDPDQEIMTDIVAQLITAGADVNKQDDTGWTALMYAVENNCLATVNILLRIQNIGVNLTSKTNDNALTIAYSVEQKLKKNEYIGKNGVAIAQNKEIIEVLKKIKISEVNEKSAEQPKQPIIDSDLQEAAQHGNVGVVQTYLADNSIAKIDEPLKSAAMYGYPKVIDEFIKKANQGQLITALGIAAQYGRTDIIEQLVPLVHREKKTLLKKVQKFFSVIEPSIKLVTPLMYACKYQHLQVVETLLNSQESTEKITIEYYDRTGMTALMWACKTAYNFPDQEIMANIVAQLITAGADVNKQDETEKTALMYAVENNCLEAVQKLLAAGARVDLRDNIYNATALVRAQNLEKTLKGSAKTEIREIIKLLRAQKTGN